MAGVLFAVVAMEKRNGRSCAAAGVAAQATTAIRRTVDRKGSSGSEVQCCAGCAGELRQWGCSFCDRRITSLYFALLRGPANNEAHFARSTHRRHGFVASAFETRRVEDVDLVCLDCGDIFLWD